MTKSWPEFRSMLKTANPALVLGPSINKYGAMVFLKAPGNPDCAPGTDLIEILAIASPSFFSVCPCESVGVEGEDGKKTYVRGYNALFRKMDKMVVNRKRVIDRNKLESLYPSAFKKWNHEKFRLALVEENKAPVSEMTKKKDWLKSRQKAIPGNGMPIGWRSDMRDTEKRELDEAVSGQSARIQDETYQQAMRA